MPDLDDLQTDAEFEAEMDAVSTVYSLHPPMVLTDAQYQAIQAFDASSRRDQERATEAFHRGYQDGLVRGAGSDVAALTNKADDARMALTVEKALRKMDWQMACRRGAAACREMMARFVERGGDAVTAGSIRANWNPSWGEDPGRISDADYAEIAAGFSRADET